MNFGNNLKVLRERNGLSLIDVSKILNISDSLYSRYEKEFRLIPIKHLNTLANYFNVSLDYLFSFSNIKQYNGSKNDIDREVSAKRLKEFRKENKLTQIKLATILNSSPAVIVHHENKRHILATPFLYTICSKYHISADYLLGKIDSPKYLK